MSELILLSLISHTLQGSVVIAVAYLFSRLSRAEEPRLLYMFWRAVLGILLVLPLFQVQPAESGIGLLVAASSRAVFGEARSPVVASVRLVPWAVLAGWAVLVLGWCVGGIRLIRSYLAGRRLVARAWPSFGPLPEAGEGVVIRESAELDSPAVWGWLRPTLLLPTGFGALPTQIRRPILAHELHHIRKRDWLWHFLEESVQVLLWFNPAVYLLLSRIRSTRELRSDRAVIEQSGESKAYVEGLLHFARSQSRRTLQPAFLGGIPFQLRIRLIQREVNMSIRLKVLFCLSGVLVLLAAVVTGATLFPRPLALVSSQESKKVAKIEEVNEPPKVIEQVLPVYPEEAEEAKIEGVVLIGLTVTSEGEATDIEVIRGPVILRQAALDAVRKFKFAPARKDGEPVAVEAVVEISFKLK